jgi:hypothetical protein
MNPIDNILPPEGYASWLDFAVETFDTRGPSLERMIADGTAPARDAMREAARAELRKLRAAAAPSLYAGDPLAPLSAAEIGQVLGLDEQSVHAKANAGQLFSIRRSGHNYGQEFSAFQAWPGVTGEPLHSGFRKKEWSLIGSRLPSRSRAGDTPRLSILAAKGRARLAR